MNQVYATLVEAAPLLWALAVTIAAILYARHRYMEPDPAICAACPLHGFCSRLGLDRLAPPQRPRHGLEARYHAFMHKVLAVAGAGALALIALQLALLGSVNLGAAGAVGALIVAVLLPGEGWEAGAER